MDRPQRLVPGLVALILLGAGCVEPGHLEHQWPALGETARFEVHTTAERDAPAVIEAVVEAVATVEAWLDPETGPLARLNLEAADDYYYFPEEQRDFYRCVLLALDYAQATHGAFDPTVGPLTRLYRREPRSVPDRDEIEAALARVGWEHVVVATETRAMRYRIDGMELDLQGVIKGFALDLAARTFSRAGVRAGLLQIGGNLYAWGEPPAEEGWSVAVPDPRRLDREFIRLRATNRGIAVSGQRELEPIAGGPSAAARRAPVLVPARGEPAAGSLLAAVAVADSGADADAMSTALFAAGYHSAAELLERMHRVEAVLLVAGDRPGSVFVVASASLQGKLELSPEIERATGGRVRFQLPPRSIALPF